MVGRRDRPGHERGGTTRGADLRISGPRGHGSHAAARLRRNLSQQTHVYWTANLYHWIAETEKVVGRKAGPDTLEATTRACYEEGQRISAYELLSALAVGNQVTRSLAAFFTDYDVLVTPTIASPALAVGAIDANDASLSARDWTEAQFTFAPFTPQQNMTGQPAMSLPLHRTAEDLPAGVQFVARYGEEHTLLMLAAQLEEALPWPRVAPLWENLV